MSLITHAELDWQFLRRLPCNVDLLTLVNTASALNRAAAWRSEFIVLRYEVLAKVGEGTYGNVLRCVHRKTGTFVAIKQFKESQDEDRVQRTAARELEVLQTLHHPNLVSFLESFRAYGRLHLVFEFMDRTLLQDMEMSIDGLPAEDVQSHMLQLVHAVAFLHKNKVMHRDLKPENMLLSQEGVLKLCDFGFARHLGGPGTQYLDYVATRWYRPPELLVGLTHYGLSVDIWALGCLLVEMATGQPLFPGKTDIDQMWLIAKSTGYLTPQQLHHVQSAPGTARFRMPNRQMRDTLECRFPCLTRAQLEVVQDTAGATAFWSPSEPQRSSLLSPLQAPEGCCQSPGVQIQASDVSMPDFKPPQGETGKDSKEHIGFRMGSLQSTGSGLIGTGHASSGIHLDTLARAQPSGGITPRSSKRSLLPDLLGEDEQATISPPEPSSPPKKSRLNKDGRCRDPRRPLSQSDLQLPAQAAMTQDMGHVTMSHTGQHTLLGAESIVSRAPAKAAWYNPCESAVHQRQSGASALPQAYARQLPSVPSAAEHYWQGQGEQLQQQPLQIGSYQPSMVMPVHAQHAQQPGWTADDCTTQVCQCEAQAGPDPQAEADAAAGGWPMPDHLVIPSQQVSQQQHQIRQPTFKDFHAADAVSADGDGHDNWQSTASASSRTSDTETDVDSNGDMDEQIAFAPARMPSKAGDGVEIAIPQVQLMSRDGRNGHIYRESLH
ncbi:TPA: hypothetical protein ACH3X2_009863 [Trebouxia sp. C0005]